MNRFERVKMIVGEALDLPADARGALLDTACGDDDELRREVESILRAGAHLPDVLATGGVSDVLGHDDPPNEIEPGQTLGHYEIEALIGSGGMGNVYRARDVRLGRTVAIKVLSRHLSHDSEYRQRLEREAQIISSLQHPGICTLYDIGRHGDIEYLVMEHIDGETLSARLERETFAIDDALQIGIQIADALDFAHRAGVIHRDLKPGNVMLTSRGVKLLDFGVAKPGARPFIVGPDAGADIDLSAPSLTRTGVLVGTVPYMSPEQLDGQSVDSRADLFALGAVLYELVTGRRAFEGQGASLVAAIMTVEPPPVHELKPDAPEPLEPILRACLAKSPEKRVQTAHDVKLQLTWALDAYRSGSTRSHAPDRRRRITSTRVVLVLAAALVVGAAALRAGRWLRSTVVATTATSSLVTRFEVPPPPGVRSIQCPRISPDGTTLAFVGTGPGGTRNIWLRSLRYVEPRPLPETEGATTVVWAPDSRRLAYFDRGLMLKIIDTTTGSIRTVCEVSEDPVSFWTHEAAWADDDRIIFDRGIRETLLEVPVAGGTPVPCSVLDTDRDELGHIRPAFSGPTMTFLVLRDGAPRTLAVRMSDGTHAYLEQAESRALPVSEDLLLYLNRTTLVLRRFDASGAAFLSDPAPVAEHVVSISRQLAEFSVSRNGVLTYRAAARSGVDLTWYDRSGAVSGVALEAGDYRFPELSKDGRIAVAQTDVLGNRDIWIYEDGQVPLRLTFRDGNDNMPLWTFDGSDIVYLATVADTSWILRASASGIGSRDTLLTSSTPLLPFSMSPDGRLLVYSHFDRQRGSSLRLLPLDPPGTPQPLPGTGGELDASVSPDGRWIVYTSSSSGRSELYVQSFPEGESRHQLTVDGARAPRWCREGREIVFIHGDAIFSIDVTRESEAIAFSRPVRLFQARVLGGLGTSAFAVTADGQRFLVPVEAEQQSSVPITVVTAWMAGVSKP